LPLKILGPASIFLHHVQSNEMERIKTSNEIKSKY